MLNSKFLRIMLQYNFPEQGYIHAFCIRHPDCHSTDRHMSVSDVYDQLLVCESIGYARLVAGNGEYGPRPPHGQ